MSHFDKLIEAMIQGNASDCMGNKEKSKQLLEEVYDERYHKGSYNKDRFQIRVNLQKKDDAASYAGWITAENNEKSGPYHGTSFVWFPGEKGSVAVLVIGTDGFGADTAILGRPGHSRRLRALSRLNNGHIWAKPDFLDIANEVPEMVIQDWPDISAALRTYGRVIYAAVAVSKLEDAVAVADLLDLFFYEHNTPLTGKTKTRWDERLSAITGAVFPSVSEEDVFDILQERRFVILDGPPGTGKTHLAYKIGAKIGSATHVQFHAARTYEDFVVGLFPKPTAQGLAFEVRPGDLLRANSLATQKEHVLVIDEINRADLARILGEAIVLFESGESGRSIRLPHTVDCQEEELSLSPNLFVLGTRNTADRSIAPLDIAVRRRFAFIQMWPRLDVIDQQDVPLAKNIFSDVIHTFTEMADEETLRLVPGHAYFLDPRPDLGKADKPKRIVRRLKFELLPLLRHYLEEKMCGIASEAIAGLADRIEAQILEFEN